MSLISQSSHEIAVVPQKRKADEMENNQPQNQTLTFGSTNLTKEQLLFSALKAENAHREALQESHQNTMSMFFKAFHSMN